MISVAAYLENERSADVKSEYVNGRCLPVVGASSIHDKLCMRLIRLLDPVLRATDHRLYRPTVKVRIHDGEDERFYYPDLQVAADEGVEHPDFLNAPRLILEVLSPADESRIREEKIPAYQRIQSLEELVLVCHDRPRIEVLRRAHDWIPQSVKPPQDLYLESIHATLLMSDLYAGLTLGN